MLAVGAEVIATVPNRIPAAKILPRRIRHCDAEDVANELLDEAKLRRLAFSLFVLPTNEFRMAPANSPLCGDWCQRWPDSLCGTYGAEFDRAELIADILSMDRQR